jgi:uncharacterized protein YlxP (DUF503 family)
MLVALERFDLRIPGCDSLKRKRHVVKSLSAAIRQRFAVSVAEVDHHELWQRARLTLSCVAREFREAEQLLDEAERYLAGQEFELVRADRRVVTLD